jgi:hypothetical protein
MTAPRRRIIRPTSPAPVLSQPLLRLRDQLAKEQESLVSWTRKLKRAFHSFEKHQIRIARLQRRIRTHEEA